MSTTLFELADFEETAPPEPTYLMFECGIHRQHAEWEAHLTDCWNGACPSCGQEITGQFDMHTNHGPAARPAWQTGLCSKQHLLMNHCRYLSAVLDGNHETTNCHATSHRGTHKRADGYFSKGAPVECSAASLIEKVTWLTSHRVSMADIDMPTTAEGAAALEAARHAVTAWLADGGVTA